MSFKGLFLGSALGFIATSAAAEEVSMEQLIQDGLHASCEKINTAIDDLNTERSQLVEGAKAYLLLDEPEQTEAVNALLKEFSGITKKIQDLGLQNAKASTTLIMRGLETGPCSPLTNPNSTWNREP